MGYNNSGRQKRKSLVTKLNVYPNPFSNALIVNTAVDLNSVIINSIHGQQVVKTESLIAGSASIKTSKLAAGLYLVSFYPKSGYPYTLKIFKY